MKEFFPNSLEPLGMEDLIIFTTLVPGFLMVGECEPGSRNNFTGLAFTAQGGRTRC
jgi:hypothetical protein